MCRPRHATASAAATNRKQSRPRVPASDPPPLRAQLPGACRLQIACAARLSLRPFPINLPWPCCRAAGVPYEEVRTVISRGDQRKPPFLAINPLGKIPALQVSPGPGAKASRS